MKEARTHNGVKIVYSIGQIHAQKMKLYHLLTPVRRIKDLNVGCEMRKILEENVGGKISNIVHSNIFSDI